MKLRLLVAYLLIVISALMVAIMPGRDHASRTIADISWPNCKDNLDLLTAERGIVGGLGGLNFHKNPCLYREDRFRITDIYLNTGYAGKNRALEFASEPKNCSRDDERCLAYNYGYKAADYALSQMFNSGVMPHRIWLDVEFGNSWSDDAQINRIVIAAMHDRLDKFMPGRVGVYSYPFQWKIITDDWQNGWPAWSATGSTKEADAIMACRLSFNGGQVLLAQYTADRLDQNVICDSADY